MFAEELTGRTYKAHAGLEKKLVTHIKNINTVDEFIQLHEIMYGFYNPLEKKNEPFLKNDCFPHWERGHYPGFPFKLSQEKVTGVSIPWKKEEIEIAENLREFIQELRSSSDYIKQN